MAGSYEHLIDRDDDAPDEGGGWSLIENMGDAYECVEELFWLVESVIGRERAINELRRFYSMSRGEIEPDAAFLYVKKKMEE